MLRNTSPYRYPVAVMLCALLGLAACASTATEPAKAQTTPASAPQAPALGNDRAAETALAQQIDAAIGLAACSADSQCRTIGLGVRACGGPAAWRPWSTQTQTKGDSLQTLADQLATLQRQRHVESGMVSNCRYFPDPGAVCVSQRCVLKKTADPAS